MGLYEDRVKRLHEHVIANEKKAATTAEPTVKQLMAMLDEKGIEYDKKANKAALLELYEKAKEKPEENSNSGECAE
jgi:hypothetical protein